MKPGDWVKRKSYGGDIIFMISDIRQGIAILEGVEYRLIADAPLDDLIPVHSREEENIEYRDKIQTTAHWIEQNRHQQYERNFGSMERSGEVENDYFEMPGKVFHLDGDPKYLQKSLELYHKLRIPVEGLHVEESEMAAVLAEWLPQIEPDIVVITGHDALLKDRQTGIYHLDSYKHSLSFVQAVRTARQFERNRDTLTIIAGACQSHFEALLQAGANFASSPGRVMIHALDPVQIAAKVSYTSIRETVNMNDVVRHTVSGMKGIGGIESLGNYRLGRPKMTELSNS